MVTKSAVIGIDLGASESYVAYVGKGIVDVVQNEVSKRGTPTLAGFSDRERMLGDQALAQIRSNAKNTCRNFKHLLGRKMDSPDLEIEHFWSLSKLVEADDGFAGYDVSYKGEPKAMSATVVTAMYLTKLREITERWCQAKVADAVISAPSCYSDVQRQALLDAAKIAGISVLRIMNEHTATALAYGIYRSNDFDPEKPMNVAFCSMGHTTFSVSIVQFVRGRLTVLCEKNDKVGGRDLDECLMRTFAGQFKKKHGCDPLSNKKALYKLEDAVTKTKKVLSANSEAPVNVECLMEDEDFASKITRLDLESMCEPAIVRVKAVLEAAKAACGLTTEQIDSVEMLGGGSRVPWVKELCKEAFGKDLSTTMNQEESVARGCALQAAILSPLYKVRDFKVEDSTPFGVEVGWTGSAADAQAAKDDEFGDTHMAGGEGETKTATVFPDGSLMDLTKMMTFYRKDAFDVKACFSEGSPLLPNTPKELGNWRVELPPQEEAKKVKVKAKLTLHGTFSIDGAQLLEEEEYEEVVKEKRELPPELEAEAEEPEGAEGEEDDKAKGDEEEPKEPAQSPDAAPAAEPEEAKPEKAEEPAVPEDAGGDKAAAEAAPEAAAKGEEEKKDAAAKDEDGDEPMPDAAKDGAEGGEPAPDAAKEEPKGDAEEKPKNGHAAEPERPKKKRKKEPEKRYEWVEVVKKKRRTKRTDLEVTVGGRPGLSDAVIAKKMDEETAMQADMKEIVETDEKRNDLESYIFNIRDKVAERGEYGPFLSEPDREKFSTELTQAEDWLYDHPEATKIEYIDKLDELKNTGDVLVWRFKEAGMRDDWIKAVQGTVDNYRTAASSPGDKYGHIAAEKLAKIVGSCNDLEKWLRDMQGKQDAMPKHEKPVLICADMEKRNQDLAKVADEILREPKPPAPKAEKKETKTDNADGKDEAPKENGGKTEGEPAAVEEPAVPSVEEKKAPPPAVPNPKKNEMDVD